MSTEFIDRGLAALTSSPILGQDSAVVDAYLDAKVEHDFLETRAAKVALAIEKLKHAFLQCGMSHVEEFRSRGSTLNARAISDLTLANDRSLRLETRMFFEVSSQTYHSPRSQSRQAIAFSVLRNFTRTAGVYC